MSYTNETKIENYLMLDIDPSFSAQVVLWISAVEKYINNYTGVKDGFESAVASIKYFDGNGKTEIDIDEFTSITTVEILESNGSSVESTLTEGLDNDYIEFPYNETKKYRLVINPGSTVGTWSYGNKRIKITAIWGADTSVPADISLAATMLLGSIIEKGAKGGKIRSESLGDYSVSFENIDDSAQSLGVKKILDRYKILTL